MRETVQRFLSKLHKETMKPLGFKKQRFTFVRQLPERVEYINFQGSAWNQQKTWVFYINIAVEFSELASYREQSGAWFKRAHAWGRSDGIVPHTPKQFELDDSTYDVVFSSISTLIPKALEAIPEHLPILFQRAKVGLKSPIPVPESWTQEKTWVERRESKGIWLTQF